MKVSPDPPMQGAKDGRETWGVKPRVIDLA